MMRIPTISSPRKPIHAAMGTKTSGCATSFINDAAIVGPIFARAARPSKPAPVAMSASGVAICATVSIVLFTTAGKRIPASPTASPRRIAMMIGFFAMPIAASLIFSERLSPLAPSPSNVSTTTEKML